MNYVIADIHGKRDKFHIMLRQIRFSEKDTLFILGDVTDRGPDGLALLFEIMNTPNMVMLLGNHEEMMRRAITDPSTTNFVTWIRNGGNNTLEDFLRLNEKDRSALTSWLYQLPSYLEIEVNGKEYFLVHGFPGPDDYSRVWGRPDHVDTQAFRMDSGKRLIIGHTPVILFHAKTDEEQDRYVRKLMQEGDHLRILHSPGFIGIDCGCGHNLPVSRLACIRLEDMKEYYV